MKYINQKMYVEKYETNQVAIDEELVNYVKDELLYDDDIDVNLIDEVLIEYLYNKDTKSQLNQEQLLLVESGEIELYQQSISEIIDEYIYSNGIDVSWGGIHDSEVIEEWITED
jgi:hypothetical protein